MMIRRIRNILTYIGPGLLVTVGFIDPGNWASNVAAGSMYGYSLLWMVTLSTLMLILLQHNAAHLGIATGLCISEAATAHLPRMISLPVLITAVLAAIATALAEILGGAIALDLLFHLPLMIGSVIMALTAALLLFTNAYRRIEKLIIGFVSIIGLSFLYELNLMPVAWNEALVGWVMPVFPAGSMPIIMSVLGAVVMPHNLFLHSEVIQSRHWNREDDRIIRQQLNYEILDTASSMLVGWAINSAMIILAAATFFRSGAKIVELGQAQQMLRPLVGEGAALIFGVALLFAGLSSSITAGMAGGSIFAGIFGRDYDIRDRYTMTGSALTIVLATFLIFFIGDPFRGLIISQMLLSVQLPVTIVTQIMLTSSEKVMGRYANPLPEKIALWIIAAIVIGLNVLLLVSLLGTKG
jgi:manganese transport protein